MFSRRTGWELSLNPFTQALREAERSGAEILDLTLSNPTRAGLAYDRAAILDSLRDESALDYDPHPKGLLSARKAVAGYYRARNETIDPETLILTSGTSEAYSYAFRLLANPGDKILVSRPSYPLLDFLADLQDVKLIPYSLIYDDGWQIDFHSLTQAIDEQTRAIVLVNPNNPTGSFVSNQERHRLNELCRKNGLALIVDEVFLDYTHDGATHPSFTSNHDALTFTLSGLSKISALPQMKLAWIAVTGPPEESKAALERLEVISDTYLSVASPIQVAAGVLLDQRSKLQPQLIERVQTNLHELDEQLRAQNLCSRLKVDGGWYAVLRVPATEPDEELAIRLLRTRGVLVHPGHFYNFESDGYLVLSLITQPEIFRRGISQILGRVPHP